MAEAADQEVPKLQLVNFEKVYIKAGDQTTVTLDFDARRMTLLFVPPPSVAGAEWVAPSWDVMPGPIAVFIGGNQPGYDNSVQQGSSPSRAPGPCQSRAVKLSVFEIMLLIK